MHLVAAGVETNGVWWEKGRNIMDFRKRKEADGNNRRKAIKKLFYLV